MVPLSRAEWLYQGVLHMVNDKGIVTYFEPATWSWCSSPTVRSRCWR